MAMRNRLTTVTRQHASLALLMFDDAGRDGVIDLDEQRAIRDQLEDTETASVAADEAGALAGMIERGVETGEYIMGKVIEFRAVIDGLPLPAA